MAYNILSGNVGETALILSGSFSGAYDGDGVQLANVNHTIQSNASAGRIPFLETNTILEATETLLIIETLIP